MRDFYLRGNIQENIISLMHEVIWLPEMFKDNAEIHQKVSNILYDRSEGEFFRKNYELVQMVIGNTKPDTTNYRLEAVCPLCGAVPETVYARGFAYPEGLKRHLEGYGNMRQCLITSLLWELGLHYKKQ